MSTPSKSHAANPPFEHRGVVEGYYGRPYTHSERVWLLERMSDWGMNRFIYAAKDDALAREDWRTPYGRAAMDEFGDLVAKGDEVGVQVGFAVSPALSIGYASKDDVASLLEKYAAFADIGSKLFCLALDDAPSRLVHQADREHFDSLADAHVLLALSLLEALPADATLWLVPDDYAGVEDSEYLEVLGEGLPLEVEVSWTGRTVVSPTIRAEEAARRSAILGRRLLLWDNVPVNDGPMRSVLHIGPYLGRDPGLVDSVSGVLLNPMERVHASALTLSTAGDFLRDPAGYDPEASWLRAIERSATGATQAFEAFARGHRFSALADEDRDEPLERAFGSVQRSFDALPTAGDEWQANFETLREVVDQRLAAAATLEKQLVDRRLFDEIEPWVRSHHAETESISAALDLLESLAAGGTQLEEALALLRMEGRLTRLETSRLVSYGPRRAMYPQLVSVADEAAAFGADTALFIGRSLVDEIIRFAEQCALDRLTR